MKRWLPDACLRGLLLLSIVLTGCAGSLDPGVVGGGGGSNGGGVGGSSGNGCQVAIFAGQCASCHTASSPQANLDLSSPNPESRLVGKMAATTNGGMCGGMTLINANTNPATGVFVDKVTMMTPPCGFSMPFGSLPSAADQACLKSWATMVANMPQAFGGEETP
jgi:hypothetical protein